MATDLSGQPLAELKQWLAISTAGEDAMATPTGEEGGEATPAE